MFHVCKLSASVMGAKVCLWVLVNRGSILDTQMSFGTEGEHAGVILEFRNKCFHNVLERRYISCSLNHVTCMVGMHLVEPVPGGAPLALTVHSEWPS